MKRTPKGAPRDERPASLIDSVFADAPSTGGICVRPYAGPRSRVCAEWGCRDSMRIAKRRHHAGKEWSRRERLAVCFWYPPSRANTLWSPFVFVISGGVMVPDYVLASWWETCAQPETLRDIARLTGHDLAAELILGARTCGHIQFCFACSDAIRVVARAPVSTDLRRAA